MSTSPPVLVIDPWAPDVREGFVRLVAGHKLRAVRRGVSIATVTREELVRPTTMRFRYDGEVALLSLPSFVDGTPDPDEHARRTEQRARLRARIAETRALLVRHSRVLHDPELSEVLADRVAAIEALDLDSGTIALPDEADFAAVEAVLAERITAIHQKLTAERIEVDPRVLLRSVTDAYRPEPVTAAATPDPELELVRRLLTRDPAGQATATMLSTRIQWQREALRQLVAEEVPAGAEPVSLSPRIILWPEQPEQGVHTLTYDSIMKCDVDIRRELYENVVLSDGEVREHRTGLFEIWRL